MIKHPLFRSSHLVLLLCAAVVPSLAIPGCAARQRASDVAPASSTAPEAGADHAPPAHAKQTMSNAGAFLVSYVTDPEPIPLNETFAVRFWIKPMMAERSATSELMVSVDAAMPHHHHGMYRHPIVRSMGSGQYEALGMLFHMPGYWEIYFDITHDGLTERAQCSVEID